MSGSQLKERVLIPLAVILGTVAVLGLLGTQLLNLSGASDQGLQAATSESPSPSATEVVPSESASASPTASASTTKATARMPVIVLNGTATAGLAKKVGDNLNFEDWVIEKVGNWTGTALTQTTVYYPAGGQEAAQELANSQYVKGVIAPADATQSQTALTLVIAK